MGALRIAAVVAGLLWAGAAWSAAMEWGECPPGSRIGSAAGMHCGWLVTGERVLGRAVRLRVIVLRERPDKQDAEPIVYIPGGPGDAAGLDAAAIRGWRRWQQRAGWPHDIVLFDPRGTGESRPRVSCDAPSVPLRGAQKELPASAGGGALQCQRSLSRRAVTALGPAAQLRDLEALADALGVERVNLWAVSFGTRIARLFERSSPGRVAAMVLDSPIPFSRSARLALPGQIQAALGQLEQFCAAPGAGCATPSPGRAIEALLARYRDSPPRVSDPLAGSAIGGYRITPDVLLEMVLLASYLPAQQADTVQRLERAVHGEAEALRPLLRRLRRQSKRAARSEAVFWSTRCAFESVGARDAAWQSALARVPSIAAYISAAQDPGCGDWALPPVGVQSDTRIAAPTLVVTGREDMVTPMRWARALVERQPRARLLEIEDGAHVPTLNNDRAQAGAAAFWRSMAASPAGG